MSNSGGYTADICRIAACLPLTFVEYSGVRAADVCRMAIQSAQILSLSYNFAQGLRFCCGRNNDNIWGCKRQSEVLHQGMPSRQGQIMQGFLLGPQSFMQTPRRKSLTSSRTTFAACTALTAGRFPVWWNRFVKSWRPKHSWKLQLRILRRLRCRLRH